MRDSIWLLLALAIGGYLIGSLSPAVFISRNMGGFDIRKRGSGNAGTTNMLREMGWLPGVLTFVCDLAKGYVPTLIALKLSGYTAAYVTGGFVLLGHAFPIFLHFKGGKCVATSAAVLMAIFPLPTLIATLLVIALMFLTRLVSLGTILGFTAFTVSTYFLPVPHPFVPYFATLVTAFVILRHWQNIIRLLHGEEKRLTIHSKKK